MATPRAVISIEVPAVRSVRVEQTFDVDNLNDATALVVIRTEGESYFLAFDPADLQLVQAAIAEFVREQTQ